jgi:hypothetical protein
MDDEFLKELQQLTLSMQQEKSNTQNTNQNDNNKSQTTNKDNKQNNPFGDFNMPFLSEGNEEDYMKELTKLLGMDLQMDQKDSGEYGDMMKLLRKFLFNS